MLLGAGVLLATTLMAHRQHTGRGDGAADDRGNEPLGPEGGF